MRKRIAGTEQTNTAGGDTDAWLDLEDIAEAEVTSEDPEFPVESALTLHGGRGWRAATPGDQTIRILFDRPVALRRIEIRFDEAQHERTHEFTLRSSRAQGAPFKEIVRQQWNFSPAGSTTEVEQYTVDLDGVASLELMIRPDLHRKDAIATLTSLRLG